MIDVAILRENSNSKTIFILHLTEEISNDVGINSYLRDLIATLHFLMDEGHVEPFKMKAIKVDKWTVTFW